MQQGSDLAPEKGRIAVYSCYFGAHEPFHQGAVGPDGAWDRIIFTDKPDLVAAGCRVVTLSGAAQGLSAKQMSRLPKLVPEAFLQNYDWVIYVDNRARLLIRAGDLVRELETRHGGAAPAGRYLSAYPFGRSCAWREARVCLRKGFLSQAEYDAVTARFEAAQFPKEHGLFMNTALVQKMGSARTESLNRAWFDAFCQVAGRDQVLLPFVKWNMGAKENDLGQPLTDLIQWPVFGKRLRRLFQEGQPLPKGWEDFPVSGSEKDD